MLLEDHFAEQEKKDKPWQHFSKVPQTKSLLNLHLVENRPDGEKYLHEGEQFPTRPENRRYELVTNNH